MSVFDENIHPANLEPHIDQLVDGELSEADRGALLLQLEREPDGWRRCALAFLEAQCWKAELSQIFAPVAPGRVAPVSQVEPTGRQSWRQYAAASLAMAASFLIALVVVHGWSGGSHSLLKATVDETPIDNRETAPSLAAAPGLHATPAIGTANDWEMVTLAEAKSSDGRPETFRVPAQRRSALDQDLLDHIPDFISPEMQQAFEHYGHRILQQREIVPVQMNDGRRLVVPVDHIEIHYVGRPSL
ncbi:MAG: hypothetical protein ACLP9L_35740 [Thermoguttaceae bacterium]